MLIPIIALITFLILYVAIKIISIALEWRKQDKEQDKERE